MSARRRIHMNEAIDLLRGGGPLEVCLWKGSNGECLVYRNCVCNYVDYRKGVARFTLMTSHEVRTAHLVCLYRVNGFEVFL